MTQETQESAFDEFALISKLLEMVSEIQSAGFGIGAIQEPDGKFNMAINTDHPGVFIEANNGEDISFLIPDND